MLAVLPKAAHPGALVAMKEIYNAEDIDKGPGSRAAGLGMAYKLIDAAQARWRAVNAPHLVALVRAGAVFNKGRLLERPTDITPVTEAAEPANAESEVA